LKKEEIEKLLKESKTFCMLPWIHLHVMPDSSVLPCCISPYDDHYGNGKTESVMEIWNSEKFKELRLNMLNGIASKGCSRCYQIEKSGFGSMRKNINNQFQRHVDLVEATKADGSLEKIDLKYIDIRFSNLCNFKCRGCGPTLSSSWFDDHQQLYNYKSEETKVRSVSAGSPKFWDELKSMTPYAEEIYFGGGEPLITQEHYEVLKHLDALQRYDVRLCYNTNLSQLNYGSVDLVEMWAKFKMVSLGISIDDLGARAEYFRSGTKWSVVEKNMIKLRDNYKGIKLYVNCTVNIMNVLYLPELFNYLTENRIISPKGMNINLLLDPHELSIQVLNPFLKTKVRNKLNVFKLQLLSKSQEYAKAALDVDNIIKFMDEDDRSDLLPTFREHTLKLDEIRKESFLTTYPELSTLLNVDDGSIA
jgi:MoaA/NifB/PqqE/SkfB family radical SAM enzyme